MSTPENEAPVLDQAGNQQVTDEVDTVDGVAVPDNESPVDKDGFALVPGTPDEQIVADRADGGIQADNPIVRDYAADIDGIVQSLGELAAKLGHDLSDAVLSDVKAERLAGVALRAALEAILDAQRAVAAANPVGAGAVAVTQGVSGV